VIKAYEHKDSTERKWLEANLDSYESPDHRIRVLVLEGSPAKGYVIVNYGTETVLAFDVFDKKLKELRLRPF
jgi:hypothetical protein